MWNFQAIIVPMGCISPKLKINIKKIGINPSIPSVQKSALLGSAIILQKVLFHMTMQDLQLKLKNQAEKIITKQQQKSRKCLSSLMWLFLATVISRSKKLISLRHTLSSGLKLPEYGTLRHLLDQLLLFGHRGL